ncbi:HEAT repeat domain-containing protein [Candidatus Poribacteria bacterium]|nr:HEAT repeat domain-containing protein [Candidatus Poribacteria bacterium]
MKKLLVFIWGITLFSTCFGGCGNEVKKNIQKLKSGDQTTRYEAVRALDDMGKKIRTERDFAAMQPAIVPLIEALKDEDAVSHAVPRALGEIAPPLGDILRDPTVMQPAISPLIKALKDENPLVRRGAIEALRLMKEKVFGYGGPTPDAMRPAVEPLREALNDENAQVHLEAFKTLKALEAIPDEMANEFLSTERKLSIAALKDEDAQTRGNAANALGEIGDESAIAPLITVLKDENATVRNQAAAALRSLAYRYRQEPAVIQPAIEPLIDALKDEDWDVRILAAYALKHIGDEKGIALGIQTLERDLNNENVDYRHQTALALKYIGGEKETELAFQALIKDLHHEDVTVRFMAAYKLGHFGDKRAIPELEQVAKKDKAKGSRSIGGRRTVSEAAQYALEMLQAQGR